MNLIGTGNCSYRTLNQLIKGVTEKDRAGLAAAHLLTDVRSPFHQTDFTINCAASGSMASCCFPLRQNGDNKTLVPLHCSKSTSILDYSWISPPELDTVMYKTPGNYSTIIICCKYVLFSQIYLQNLTSSPLNIVGIPAICFPFGKGLLLQSLLITVYSFTTH